MNFYKIGVSSTKYHGSDPLTYASDKTIPIGTIVVAPLRSNQTLGIVLGKGQAPKGFKPKPIGTIYHEITLPKTQLELLEWLRRYYPAPLSSIVQLFLPTQIREKVQRPASNQQPESLPPLTKEQRSALRTLSTTKSSVALLHGDTGTGKTRVYVELARKVIARAKSVIILVPEIGLVPQMVQEFASQFPGLVSSIHSGMTDKQRQETWRAIYNNQQPQVVIGPRSALFMPVKNIGLVVVDEAHDTGYKQGQLPYYEATRAAAKLATISSGLCVYGTATPRIADYWHLGKHHTPILRLSKQINDSIKPPRHTIIDASKREQFSKSSVFADAMLSAIDEALFKNEQTLIFLNRRGTARFVSCSSCGWHAACPACDTPLTYHRDHHQLRCHTCGIKQPVPTSCPECESTEIRYQRRGTKALQAELQKLFPEARIARFDSDNIKEETLAAQYEKLSSNNIDIIIGTQVIAKGLDLSHLSLVCVPQADLSTYLPDFTADEQTFQLLRQVIGRVGRTDKTSQVIIQTYQPDSQVIQAAVTNDWVSMYDQQIKHRQKYNFPPFCYLLQLTTIKSSPESARRTAVKLRSEIQKAYTKIEILGPAPRFHEKIQGKYQWQLVLKAKQRQDLLQVIKNLPNGWRHNIDPTNLL